MGELSIRRNREISVPQYKKLGKTEKQAGTAQAQRPVGQRAADSVSETLRQLMSRVTQAGRQAQEGRRTLRSGEAALAEVEDNLGKMEELAKESAGAGGVDRDALQTELEQLRGEIDRITRAGIKAGLFQDGGDGEELDALVDAIMDGLSAKQEGVESLPAWLLKGMASAPSRSELLSALGMNDAASGAMLSAALGRLPLDSNSASGYLATVYLGVIISGGMPSGEVDMDKVTEGLQQFLEMVAEGASPDEAIDLLTSGMFTSVEDFQTQFMEGTVPGLDAFLSELLLSGGGGTEDMLASILAMLAGGGGGGDMGMDMLMDLLAMLDGSGGLLAMLDGTGTSAPEGAAAQMETAAFGTVQVSGRDLSGVSFDEAAGVLTVGGAEDLVLRAGQGQEITAVRITGSGTVTLQQINIPLLSVESAQARVVSAGETVLAQLQLGAGTVLTLDGSGRLQIAAFRGEGASLLRLTGGTVALSQEAQAALAGRIVADGPVSLLAAENLAVQNAQGQPMTPFDIIWKTLLPNWSELTSLVMDGKQGQLALLRGDQQDLVRLWLLKQDSDERQPAHTLALRGRDRAGHARTQYIYVRWDEKSGGFQEISMYPNPFTVTGGEQDVDWSYEEESHTLCILTREVTAISGGAGMDSNEQPFSGRIVLSDNIGRVELTLDGVKCRVDFGRAFSLGRANEVTLLLQRGTDNVFESGKGCAGISLGDGTSLRIDQTREPKGGPDGTLTATGGSGGAGIGRDSGAGQERTGAILIRDGVVTATGTGGGAGIGGALGGPVGDIRIQGGTVTAQAACSAAAIGAGIQGACGDILISGTAKVAKAQGGGPDGDIGGCLFGDCGRVRVDAGTDIGSAKLWTHQGISMQVGEGAVTMPKFRVSVKALGLDGLDISTREAAKAAMSVLTTDRRWVTRLQGAYGAMYGQLAQSFGGMYNVHRHFSVVRDNSEASSLVTDIREVLRQSPKAKFLAKRGMEDVAYLLR